MAADPPRAAPRIGVQIQPGEHERPFPSLVEQAQRAADAGLHRVWMGQGFDVDALTALAVVGAQVEGVELGTQVVPAWPRHPLILASQALTVQAATSNRLTLGIGLSHRSTVERSWGHRFDDPIGYLEEYLAVLIGTFEHGTVRHDGDRIVARTPFPIGIPGARAPEVVLGVLGARALAVAGRLADGVLTTFTGPRGLAEHVVPIVTAAAADAGRPAPRVIAALPIAVTDDVDGATGGLLHHFAALTRLPSYAAALDREGASGPADVAAIGDDAHVRARLTSLLDAGATEVSPFLVGPTADHPRAIAVLADLAGGT